MFVGADHAAVRARQGCVVEPVVAGHAGHEQDQVGREGSGFGLHAVGAETLRFLAEVRADASLLHLVEQSLDRFAAESLPGFLGRAEEVQGEVLPAPVLAQPGIDSEEELEYGAAAHGRRLLRVARKAECDRPRFHGLESIAQASDLLWSAAGKKAVLDAGQLAQELPAAGDDQAVVGDLARFGVERPGVVGQAGGARGVMVDAHALEEALERCDQVLGPALAGGDPDRARVVDQFRLGADHVDAQVGVGAS